MESGFNAGGGLLNDGRVVFWGGGDGAIGDGAFVPEPPADPMTQIDIAGSGSGEGCGLGADGSIACWCGDYNETCDPSLPAGNGFVQVQHGLWWACAERTDHRLECWGLRSGGLLEPPTEPVLDWSIEGNYGCAVLTDSSVSCWGDGYAQFAQSPEAETEPPADLKYTQVATGRTHACAIDTERNAHCWGSTWNRTPFHQPTTAGPWDRVVAWHQVACGLRDADGFAECWHDDAFIYGNDDGLWQLPDERWAMIGLGEWSACGLTLDGRAVCFPAPFEHLGEQHPPSLADLQ